MDRVPDWVIERYLLGELAEPRLGELERRLAADPELVARVSALRADGERILGEAPPRVFAARVAERARLGGPPERSRSFTWLALPAVALAAALLAVPALDGLRPWEVDGEVTRLKGDAHLVLHRRSGSSAVALADGDPARAGDLIQVSVQAGRYTWGAVMSVDGRGAVTVHHPPGGSPTPGGPCARPGWACELAPGEAHPLGQAYELDDAPGFERFFLVASDAPFEIDAALDALEALAEDPAAARTEALALPDELVHRSVLLVKEER